MEELKQFDDADDDEEIDKLISQADKQLEIAN